jgi:hypothetical protein
LMVSTSELTVVMFADTADLVRFLYLFFASAAWVVAWEAGIFPVVCRVRRDTATLDGILRDVAGASLSLPTVESETYSSMGEPALPACPPRREPCSCASPRHAVVPGTGTCLRSAENKTSKFNENQHPRRTLS